jgi:elongation factor G
VDDQLGEMFLNEETPNEQQIHVTIETRQTVTLYIWREIFIQDAIRRCVISRTFQPIFVGSALKNKGVQPLLDFVNRYLPNPAEVENTAFNEFGSVKTNDMNEKGTFLAFSKEKKMIKLDPARSFAAPFVGFAFKIEVSEPKGSSDRRT